MNRRELLIGVPVLAIMSLADGAAAAVGARTHSIEMQNMRFGPSPANIRAGDTIIWINRDLVAHTATARNHSFDVVIPSGGRATTVVRQAGTIAYYCRYHPAMGGSLAAGRKRPT
jgi:plastocyanin